jgi:hypothetical protein
MVGNNSTLFCVRVAQISCLLDSKIALIVDGAQRIGCVTDLFYRHLQHKRCLAVPSNNIRVDLSCNCAVSRQRCCVVDDNYRKIS